MRTILILMFFIFMSQANAEMVNKWIIEGNKRVSDETIRVYGDIEINRDISESDLNKFINNLYSTNFFEDVSARISSNTLFIKVGEYPIVNQLIIVGEPRDAYVEQIQKIISTKKKNHLSDHF